MLEHPSIAMLGYPSIDAWLFRKGMRITEKVLLIPCIFEVFATEFIVSFVCRKTKSYTVSRGELNPVYTVHIGQFKYFQYVYPLCATNRPFSNILSIDRLMVDFKREFS